MTNSTELDALDAKHEQNRQERLEAVERWVEYIETHPPEVWGPQQNAIVNAQIEAAQQADHSVEHEQRVRAFAREAGAADESGDSDSSE